MQVGAEDEDELGSFREPGDAIGTSGVPRTGSHDRGRCPRLSTTAACGGRGRPDGSAIPLVPPSRAQRLLPRRRSFRGAVTVRALGSSARGARVLDPALGSVRSDGDSDRADREHPSSSLVDRGDARRPPRVGSAPSSSMRSTRTRFGRRSRGSRRPALRSITDGEQRKPSFATYPVDGLEGLAPDGVVIPFEDGHTRQLPRLTRGPFRYQTYADEYLVEAQRRRDTATQAGGDLGLRDQPHLPPGGDRRATRARSFSPIS